MHFIFKGLVALLALAAVAWSPAMAAGPESEWQNVISVQIEAFRSGDGETALDMANADFQQQFPDASTFVRTVESWGYDPLVRSLSHSFGPFTRVDESHVVQIVRLVGPDQFIYRALYHLEQEADGWRVEGVGLMRDEGLAV